MKITTNKKITTEVPLRTPAEFQRQMSNTQFQASVTAIITSSDLATYIRRLNQITRPFAIATLEVK